MKVGFGVLMTLKVGWVVTVKEDDLDGAGVVDEAGASVGLGAVGIGVGLSVGAGAVGSGVGLGVGACVGSGVGSGVGLGVGSGVGT